MKISIVTVCYNSQSTIKDTILSVVNQTYENIEYLIIDGGSTDLTPQIVSEYTSSIDYFISEADDGIYHAMNKGIAAATGDVIAILNSDDFFIDDDVLAQIATLFKVYPNIDIICGGVDMVNAKDLTRAVRRYSAQGFKPWMVRFGLMPPHPGCFIRKRAYDNSGLYKPQFKHAADFDLLCRMLLKQKISYKLIPKRLVVMRTGGASNRDIKSILNGTNEISAILRDNNIKSNLIFVSCRILIKLIFQTWVRLRMRSNNRLQ